MALGFAVCEFFIRVSSDALSSSAVNKKGQLTDRCRDNLGIHVIWHILP